MPRVAPVLLLGLMLLPVAAGLGFTLLPAFGWLPALGGNAVGLASWRALLRAPGFVRSLELTVWTGGAATILSLVAALGIAAVARAAIPRRLARSWIAPVLATPHAALAIGLSFLLAPSGWIARLVALGLTGWRVPPDLATVQDRWGVALILGLCVKEAPFLLLMALAALDQAEAEPSLRAAAALGYGPLRAWTLAVLPRIWPQLRLPVLAVLAFSLSVVDVALVLGPTDPPPLAPLVFGWFSDPDLRLWFPASAGAVLLLGVTLAGFAFLLGAERLLGAIGRRALRRGRRGGEGRGARALFLAAGAALGGLGLFSLVVLGVWSFARVWRFPAALPQRWSTGAWARADLPGPAWATLWIGAGAVLIALALCIACLENERRLGRGPSRLGVAVLYLPLLVPQIAFLFGMQVVLVRLRLDGGAAALIWAHLVFVMPYVFLSLAEPWRALDPRYARAAACLGAPPWRVLLRVSLPLLARPVLAAGAVGFAVSAGLYLPTLFAGAGRVATLTTEAIALAGGEDRRVLGAVGLAQAALPLLGYALAVGLPSWRARRLHGRAVPAR